MTLRGYISISELIPWIGVGGRPQNNFIKLRLQCRLQLNFSHFEFPKLDFLQLNKLGNCLVYK